MRGKLHLLTVQESYHLTLEVDGEKIPTVKYAGQIVFGPFGELCVYFASLPLGHVQFMRASQQPREQTVNAFE